MSEKSLRQARASIRLALLRLGARLPSRTISALSNAVAHLELGARLDPSADHIRPQVVSDDLAVFEVARRLVTGARPLYLEFGVFEGRSMRWWSDNLRQPGARFVGFDSFEGLPEDWQAGFPAGFFKTGSPPRIPDERVSFVTGWFDETLPKFELPRHDQLIVNIDCDLYSSTRTVLEALRSHMRPGTIVYFDEFPSPDHELRAFREFLDAHPRSARPRAVSRNSFHWLFEMT